MATDDTTRTCSEETVYGKTKTMPCRECDEPVTVHISTVNPPRHFECGVKAGVRAMQEMHNKRGPTYNRYLAGMRAYVLTESYREPTDPPTATTLPSNP